MRPVGVTGAVAVQLRGGSVLVAEVRHQDRAVGGLDRPQDGDADPGQGPQHLPLAGNPDPPWTSRPYRVRLSIATRIPSLLDELAVAVEGLVAEVSPVERVVDLQRRQLLAGRARIGAAQMHAGSLPLLMGRMTRSMSPSSRKCSMASSYKAIAPSVRGTEACGDAASFGATAGSRTAQRASEGRGARTLSRLAAISHPSFRCFVIDAIVASCGRVYALVRADVGDRLVVFPERRHRSHD